MYVFKYTVPQKVSCIVKALGLKVNQNRGKIRQNQCMTVPLQNLGNATKVPG